MKSNLIKFIHLGIFLIIASCLPQEKTTQCGSGEAYNATQRKCVTTLANSTNSISISSVTPSSSYAISGADPSITHSITVSDPYTLGYSVKWNLTQPNGTVLLVGTGLSYIFVHNAFTTGSYIIEAQVLDSAGSRVLDTRSWTINYISETIPTISEITATPFATTITSAATNVQATISNPDSISNVNYAWYVNGTAVVGSSGTTSAPSSNQSFSFDPTSAASYYAGAGNYSLQLVLTENGSNVQYDTFTWSISNNIPGFTTASLGIGDAGAALNNATPNTAALITVLDEVDVFAGGFLNDIDNDLTMDAVDICVQVADITGVDGNGVYVDFLANGVAIPNATNIPFTVNATPKCLGTVVNGAGATYSMNIPASINVESRTITAVVYDRYSGPSSFPSYNGGAEITRYNWTARVRQQNAAPVLTIDTTNTNSGGNVPCASSSTTSSSGCTVTQDTLFKLAIDVSDDADGDGVQDYDPNSAADFQHFQVEFYMDGVLVDGSHGSSIADCYHTYADALPNQTTRYICDMYINSWDANGPVDPAGKSYTITAKVKDDASPYALATESGYSNEISWTINTVNPYDSGLTLNPFISGGAPTATDSYVSEQATPGVPIIINAAGATVQENETVFFKVNVNEPERDDHYIKILRCDDGVAACLTPTTVATKQVISTDDTEDRLTTIAVQISEDAVKNAASANVYYKIIVAKDSTVPAAPYSDFEVIFFEIQNDNPIPTLTQNYTPALNTVGTQLIAYSGFPITIDSGTITDASIADGETVLYQWMIAVDSNQDGDTSDETYEAIDGATSKNLIWTPGSEIDFALATGTAVTIKLCLGDNGYDVASARTAMNAGGTNCLNTGNAAMESGEWFIKSFSNMYQGESYMASTAANTSSGEVATWIDPSTKDPVVKYMAYVNVNKEIVVEKFVTTATTGVKGGSVETAAEEMSSIIFPASTDAFFSSNEVTNLSITGDATNGALYISYMAPIGNPLVDIVHIRRIDISGGKTGFIHEGKFGWDNGYNDLSDNFSPGAGSGLTENVNANGQLEITVTQSGDTQPSMSLTLDGSVISIPLGHFCTGSCSNTTVTATEIATAINASVLEGFQGVTATASGAVVTLDGIYEDDFIEADIGATSIGSIMVNKTTGKWQLPMIDHDFTGADKHKLSMYQGNLNSRLVDALASKTAIGFNDTLPAQEITNDILESDPNADGTTDGNDRILIATKNIADDNIAIYEYDANLNLIEFDTDLMNDSDISNIKLKISQVFTNNAAYIMGHNASNSYAYARINYTGATMSVANFTLAAGSPKIVVDLDNDFTLIENGNAPNFDIAPGSNAYELFMATVDSVNSSAYLLKIKGAAPTIDCSYDSDQDLTKCMKLLSVQSTADTIFNLPVALSDVLSDVTIGSAGATASENTNDIVSVIYHKDDGGGVSTTDALPILGILNTTGIDLTGDTTNPGEVYNIPYVNN